MEIGSMALLEEELMGGNPSVADASSLAVGNGDGMDGIGIVVIQNK
jgi:hypothetical protein